MTVRAPGRVPRGRHREMVSALRAVLLTLLFVLVVSGLGMLLLRSALH